MSKKVLSAEERVVKYGNIIAGVGIFYLVLEAIVLFMQTSILLNPVSLIMYGVQIAMLLAMVIGIKKRQKYGITAAWVFEGYMIFLLILALLGIGGVDLIALLVMIWLPSEIKSFSKALKELNSANQEDTTTTDSSQTL